MCWCATANYRCEYVVFTPLKTFTAKDAKDAKESQRRVKNITVIPVKLIRLAPRSPLDRRYSRIFLGVLGGECFS